MKWFKALIFTSGLIFAITAGSSRALASTVDGVVTAADGYTQVYDVSFDYGNTGMGGVGGMGGMGGTGTVGGTIGGGKLWEKFNTSGQLIQFAYELPTAYVDNTYGTGSIGNYGGQNHTHTFQDLLGSDEATFQLNDANGKALTSFSADYIAAITDGTGGTGGMAPMAAPPPPPGGGGTTAFAYQSAGVLANGQSQDGGIIANADGSQVAATDPLASQVPEVATSLQYNLAYYGLTAGGLDLTTNSPGATLDSSGNYVITPNASNPSDNWSHWQFGVIYEVAIDPTQFSSAPTSVFLSEAHASPAKTEGTLTNPHTTQVPEPASLSLAAAGVALLLVRRRRSVA